MGTYRTSWDKHNSNFIVKNVHHKTMLHTYIRVQCRFLTFELLIIFNLYYFLIDQILKLRKIQFYPSLKPSHFSILHVLDHRLNWHNHLKETKTKAQNNLVSLKMFKNKRFGSRPRKMINIYRTLVRSVTDYGSLESVQFFEHSLLSNTCHANVIQLATYIHKTRISNTNILHENCRNTKT